MFSNSGQNWQLILQAGVDFTYKDKLQQKCADKK
jgi:hypothetical protein